MNKLKEKIINQIREDLILMDDTYLSHRCIGMIYDAILAELNIDVSKIDPARIDVIIKKGGVDE